MSALVSRILLAMLMLPAGGLVYLIALVFAARAIGWYARPWPFVFAGIATWIFVAGYWTLLWRSSVRWNASRLTSTLLAAAAAVVAGFIAAVFVDAVEREVGDFVGSVCAPLLWLILATLLWRETPTERASRLRSVRVTGIVCPKCGYNLTGLQSTRCPECGTLFTLDEILVEQPSRANREVG